MKAAVDEFLRGAGIDVSATAWSQLDEIFEHVMLSDTVSTTQGAKSL